MHDIVKSHSATIHTTLILHAPILLFRQLLQKLLPPLAPDIQKPFLSIAHRSVIQSFPQPLQIRRRSIEHTPIIPDCHIIWMLPALPRLQIIIIHDQLCEPFQQRLRFQRRYMVNVLHVGVDCEDRLPVCDRAGTNDGLEGGQFFADVVRGTTAVSVDFEATISFWRARWTVAARTWSSEC